MEKHLNVIAILWIVFGALGLLFGLIVFGILFGLSFLPELETGGIIALRGVAAGVAFFFTVLALPQIIGGIGLMKKHEWARILVLVMSFFSLINFPLGTALAIYSFVILINEETVQLFRA